MKEARVVMSSLLTGFLHRAVCNLAGEPPPWRRWCYNANGECIPNDPPDVKAWRLPNNGRPWDADNPLQLGSYRMVRLPDEWGGHLRQMHIMVQVYRGDFAMGLSETVAWLASGARHTRPLSEARVVLVLDWGWYRSNEKGPSTVPGVCFEAEWKLLPGRKSWRTCYAEILRHIAEFSKIPPQRWRSPFSHEPREGWRRSVTEDALRTQRLRAQWKAEDRARRALETAKKNPKKQKESA
jgi:hypothetical protein